MCRNFYRLHHICDRIHDRYSFTVSCSHPFSWCRISLWYSDRIYTCTNRIYAWSMCVFSSRKIHAAAICYTFSWDLSHFQRNRQSNHRKWLEDCYPAAVIAHYTIQHTKLRTVVNKDKILGLHFGFRYRFCHILIFLIFKGMLPQTILFVHMGTAMKSLSDVTGNEDSSNNYIWFIGILVSIVSIGVITAITSKAIQMVSFLKFFY